MVEIMALNLKNPETERLAKQLAHSTGETITRAVTVAIKERLERANSRSRKAKGQLDRMIEIVNRTSSRIRDRRPSKELFDELYDDSGMPR
jgi:antitoxin VapB